MISFELTGGEAEIIQLLDHLHLFSLAESLGGVESLIAHPATMTHAAMDEQARAVAGISNQLLRLSVGLEAVEDLLADLTQAFASIQVKSPLGAHLATFKSSNAQQLNEQLCPV